MSRPYRLLFWPALVGSILALLYASLPMLVSSLVTQALTAQGLKDISVDIGYPGWRGARLHTLAFSGIAGGRPFSFQANDVELDYQLNQLAAGRVAAIRIPAARLRIQSTPIEPLPAPDTKSAPLSAFVPASWLPTVPVRNLLLEHLEILWQEPSTTAYRVDLNGRLFNTELQLQGTLHQTARPADSVQFSAQVAATGRSHLSFTASAQPGEPLLDVSLHTALGNQQRLDIEGTVQAELDALARYFDPWLRLSDHTAGLEGTLHTQWLATVDATSRAAGLLENASLRSESVLKFHAERLSEWANESDAYVDLNLTLDNGTLHWKLAENTRLSTALKRPATAQSEKKPVLVVTLPSPLSGKLDLLKKETQLEIEQPARIRVHPVAVGEVSLPRTQIGLSRPFVLRYQSGRLRSEPVALSITASPVQWRKDTFHHDGLTIALQQLQFENAKWDIAGEARVNRLSGQIGTQSLPTMDVHALFQFDSQKIQTQSSLRAAGGNLVLQCEAIHRLATENGQLEFQLKPVNFSESGFTLSKLFETWPYHFDITSGRLSGSGQVSWKPAASPTGNGKLVSREELLLSLEKIGGHHEKISFTGLSTEIALENRDTYRTTKEVLVTLDRLDVGLPIENIAAGLNLSQQGKNRQPLFRVDTFSAELLGGRVRSEPFELDMGRDSNRLLLYIDQFSLSELLKLEKQEGLEGSGLLDGRLPLEITQDGLRIQDGKLSARAPGGIVHYSPSTNVLQMAKNNTDVKLLTEILSDFHYQTLDVTSNYSPQGDLTLQISLKGNNPHWRSGQPVHLNPTMEIKNVPALLRSLQLAGKLGEEIGERVRRGYRGSP